MQHILCAMKTLQNSFVRMQISAATESTSRTPEHSSTAVAATAASLNQVVASRYLSGERGPSKRSRPEDPSTDTAAGVLLDAMDAGAAAATNSDGDVAGKPSKKSRLKKESSGNSDGQKAAKVMLRNALDFFTNHLTA